MPTVAKNLPMPNNPPRSSKNNHAMPSRRGFLAALGSALGALCLAPFAKPAAAAPIAASPTAAPATTAIPQPAGPPSRLPSPLITGPGKVTVYTYDHNGKLVLVVQSSATSRPTNGR